MNQTIPSPELPADVNPPPNWPPRVGRSAEPEDFKRGNPATMSTSTNVICDKCGSVIMESRVVLDYRCGPAADRHREIDLCQDCHELFRGWLAAGRVESFNLSAR